MTIINTYAAESWDKVYSAFTQINFTSYDYDTVKESLLQYLQIYHAEDFNDYIESSELTAILELFAYAAELLAYRTDTVAHENFITTAQRKQNILRLAKLISYGASRNIPARGLVKINTIRTSESVFDSLGNNLANVTITWNDPNNTNWKEQFFLVMNLVLTSRFGQPSKSFQIADVLMQLYTFNNDLKAFKNGVFAFTASGTTDSLPMEVVPIDIDSNGPLERAPDLNAQFNIVYASDGRGDGSDYTGFLMFVKQGNLILTDYEITEPVANRRLVLNNINVNDTDVWIYNVDDNGTILEKWTAVETLTDQTLAFNNIETRKKYAIETLENDQIAILFGDGNFSDVPSGNFQLWTRVSVNQDITIPKNRVAGQAMSFSYLNTQNVSHTCNIAFSLTSALQNNAASETIEHVRQSAPSTYYAQNRMVNGQDHNTFMLRDSTILKLNTINRTFAGQPKYIEWNDASGAYQNIKLFGDDLTLQLLTAVDLVETTTASKGIIDSFIEPTLSTNALLNVLTHVMATAPESKGIISYPRRKFIEDNRQIYFDVQPELAITFGGSGYVNGTYTAVALTGGSGTGATATIVVDSGVVIAATILTGSGYAVNDVLTTSNTNLGGSGSGLTLTVLSERSVNPYGKQIGGLDLQTGNGSLLEKTVIQGALDGHWYGEPLSTVTINGTLHGVIPDPILNPKSNSKLYISDLPRTIDGANTYPPGDTGSGLQAIQRQTYFGLKFNRFLKAFGSGDITLTGTPVGIDQTKTETFTIEMTSDGTTFTVVSNLRGRLHDYSLTIAQTPGLENWSAQAGISVPVDFSISSSATFESGDAFIIDLRYSSGWVQSVRTFGALNRTKVNLSGWWELIPADVVTNDLGLFSGGAGDGPNAVEQLIFDQSPTAGTGDAWIFLVARTDDNLGDVASWSIYNRDMKIIASSPTTKFWFNQDAQLIDSETLKPLYDKIRILRSNLDASGEPLKKADIYDCVGFVYDSNGEIITHQLEILPTDTINFTQAGDGTPDNILQFETFAEGAYQYTLFNVQSSTPEVVGVVSCTNVSAISLDGLQVTVSGKTYTFGDGSMISDTVDGFRLGRQLFVPAPSVVDPSTDQLGCNVIDGLDFMWQHYTPSSNLIDPSPTNIHDAFILTSGYYNSVTDYINGLSSVAPTPPTPLDLRTSYGYLLNNKMLSDTIVLHSGKIKLLFGSLADQTLRAKFRVVMASTATFSSERIKQEVINVVNKYFQIKDWDFGKTFYATELLSLIHQALKTQIASVVLVPTYSVNSFGSLFTINAGFDEVLQSAATVSDVEIVSALTPTVLRQNI